MVGHGGSSAGSYLADPTSPIPSHCASIVATSTLRVKIINLNREANETTITSYDTRRVSIAKVFIYHSCRTWGNADLCIVYRNTVKNTGHNKHYYIPALIKKFPIAVLPVSVARKHLQQ